MHISIIIKTDRR